jgi:hypothetical protein
VRTLARVTPRFLQRALVPLLLAAACGGQALDAGSDSPRGLLPVDARNQVILSNDGCGNWQGLYAVLFSNAGGPPLCGITVNASSYATDLNANLVAWQSLVSAARASGLRDIPDPVVSASSPLARPSDGNIDTTVPNRSDGAQAIVALSARFSLPYRPVVVVVGGRLTDVADAYLIDPTVTERVVVVAALGALSTGGAGAVMGSPNGELDPWADAIVAQKFRYIQVSAFYDPTTDIPTSRLGDLPQNPLGDLVASLQPSVTATLSQADQVSILAVGLPAFVTAVAEVAQDPTVAFSSTTGPSLVPHPDGSNWLVTSIDSASANARLWEMLQDPKTFGQ